MKRELLWALLALAIAILLAYIFVNIVQDDAQGTSLPPLPKCVDDQTRDKLQRLSSRALDEGYQKHVAHLFDIWMGSPNTEQFNRARNGMQNGIKGYLIGQSYVDAWIPPVCP